MKTFCPNCKNTFDVSDDVACTQIACPSCSQTFHADPYEGPQPLKCPPARKKRLPPGLPLGTIAVVCDILCTVNMVVLLVFLLVFFFIRDFWLLLYGLILFSISWALYAGSAIIRQTDAEAKEAGETMDGPT